MDTASLYLNSARIVRDRAGAGQRASASAASRDDDRWHLFRGVVAGERRLIRRRPGGPNALSVTDRRFASSVTGNGAAPTAEADAMDYSAVDAAKRTVIMGAGPAGLTAAYELMR